MGEGVTYLRPSRFIRVCTMSPEEGELRPQLLDRFGLCVEISGEKEILLRKQIVDRVLSFESEEPGFLEEWAQKDAALRDRIVSAPRELPGVRLSAANLAG